MTASYDPKVVALTALGLACFAFGFSVTAVAYPSVAHSAATNPTAAIEGSIASEVTASGAPHSLNVTRRARGCQHE